MHYKKYKSILSPKNNMNLYRGCTHGCIYCDSRSVCYGIDHVFEDIEVKQDADKQLDSELRRRKKRCMVGMGSMCDPYMHIEEELQLTRRSLEVILRNGFGVAFITKSARVLRDLDLLREINTRTKCVVQMTLTTYDEELVKILEPNVSTTRERFEALCTLRDNGIPTVVWMDPILPFINDTEENLRGLMGYCAEAGVRGIVHFGFGMTLREGDREYYYAALDKFFPGLKRKYIEKYGNVYSIMCDNNNELMKIFRAECKRHGILYKPKDVFGYINEFVDSYEGEQITMF